MSTRLPAALVCATAVCWAFSSGVASADPAPADPAVIVPTAGTDAPPPAPVDPFAAASAMTQSNPTGFLTQLLGPGGVSSGAMIGLSQAPPTDALAAAASLLMPNNYRMPAGDNPYVMESNVPPGPFARVDAFRGQHAMAHAGYGRMPGNELGVPLPGTAPQPGMNIPAGLEQYYVPPAAPADTAPVVPLIPPAG